MLPLFECAEGQHAEIGTFGQVTYTLDSNKRRLVANWRSKKITPYGPTFMGIIEQVRP